MNIILPILSFLCGVMLTETASGSYLERESLLPA